MIDRRIYIQDATQISIQKPLCEEWMTAPVRYDVPYARSIDPDFKEFFSPLEGRRMGKILKRALASSLRVVRTTGITQPDAIISGTGLGCIENTEIFLTAMCEEGESLLKPTSFMQSTHNTISSLLSINLKCHGYNVTYAHKGISFDSAMFDAWLQLRLGKIGNALVGSHDEITPSYFTLLQRIGYVGGDMEGVCGEASVAAMLNTEKGEDALCELKSMSMLYKPSAAKLKKALANLLGDAGVEYDELDAVITGVNGNRVNDEQYASAVAELCPSLPEVRYKHLFGECYSASGLALYAAAHCLHKGMIPEFMRFGDTPLKDDVPKNLLLFNQFEGKTYSMILLSSVCGR